MFRLIKKIVKWSLISVGGLTVLSVVIAMTIEPSAPRQQAANEQNPIEQTKEIEIPSSRPGDKGRYYLIELTKEGNVIKALHKRVGPSGTGYTRTETDCNKGLMREMGYKDNTPAGMTINPTKWFELVPGSSKSDLYNFICKNSG